MITYGPIVISRGIPDTLYILYEASIPSLTRITLYSRYPTICRISGSVPGIPRLVPIEGIRPDSEYRVSISCGMHSRETTFNTYHEQVHIGAYPYTGIADTYIHLLPTPDPVGAIHYDDMVDRYRHHYRANSYYPTGIHLIVGSPSYRVSLPCDWEDIVATVGWDGLSALYDIHRDKEAIAHMQVCHEYGILLSGTIEIGGKGMHIYDGGPIPEDIDILLSTVPMNMFRHNSPTGTYDIVCRHPSLSGETAIANGHTQYTVSMGRRSIGTRILWWLLRLSCMGHRYFTTKGSYVSIGMGMVTPLLLV